MVQREQQMVILFQIRWHRDLNFIVERRALVMVVDGSEC